MGNLFPPRNFYCTRWINAVGLQGPRQLNNDYFDIDIDIDDFRDFDYFFDYDDDQSKLASEAKVKAASVVK